MKDYLPIKMAPNILLAPAPSGESIEIYGHFYTVLQLLAYVNMVLNVWIHYG
jgi:hypothetical protein